MILQAQMFHSLVDRCFFHVLSLFLHIFVRAKITDTTLLPCIDSRIVLPCTASTSADQPHQVGLLDTLLHLGHPQWSTTVTFTQGKSAF